MFIKDRFYVKKNELYKYLLPDLSLKITKNQNLSYVTIREYKEINSLQNHTNILV